MKTCVIICEKHGQRQITWLNWGEYINELALPLSRKHMSETFLIYIFFLFILKLYSYRTVVLREVICLNIPIRRIRFWQCRMKPTMAHLPLTPSWLKLVYFIKFLKKSVEFCKKKKRYFWNVTWKKNLGIFQNFTYFFNEHCG